MRRQGFTLIELLVVIAIIAILAAILFPVFAQAKLSAKKSAGLTQAKQIGLGMHIYLADHDDVLFPYRLNGPGGSSITGDAAVNPDYQLARQQLGDARADELFGPRARNVVFFKQMLDPYIKSNDLWRGPTKTGAWVGYDNIGTDTEPLFRSYGGQNSYGVNNYAFTATAGTSSTGGGLPFNVIVEPSNTLIMTDSSYYNVLPRFAGRLNGAIGTFDPCSSTYPEYWKNIGNSYLFRWDVGANAANPPSDEEAEALIDQRYSGMLNVIRADTSARAYRTSAVINDLRDKGEESMWDPYKQGYTECP